jgi:hypothetical protein
MIRHTRFEPAERVSLVRMHTANKTGERLHAVDIDAARRPIHHPAHRAVVRDLAIDQLNALGQRAGSSRKR